MMSEKNILIIGMGTVGTNLYNELCPYFNIFCYDKYKGINNKSSHHDLAFICVDTPLNKEGTDLDTTEVINAVKENDAEVFVIKSTCPITTTNYIHIKYNKRVVYSPEYYGATQHCNNYDYNFTILGGEKADCRYVQEILQECYDARHLFRITDSNTAELVKFMENSWIATKVSFCNQFYDIAKANGIYYGELRELFLLDPRVNPSHTFVYQDHPYWDSHCLNKDVPAVAESENAEFLKAVVKFNENRKP